MLFFFQSSPEPGCVPRAVRFPASVAAQGSGDSAAAAPAKGGGKSKQGRQGHVSASIEGTRSRAIKVQALGEEGMNSKAEGWLPAPPCPCHETLCQEKSS